MYNIHGAQPLPSPRHLSITVGKNLQRDLLAAICQLVEDFNKYCLQKCCLWEGVHKGVTLFSRKGIIVSANAGYKGKILRHRRSKDRLWYKWREVWKCVCWRKMLKGDRQHRSGGESSEDLQECRRMGDQACMFAEKGSDWSSGYNTTDNTTVFAATLSTSTCNT